MLGFLLPVGVNYNFIDREKNRESVQRSSPPDLWSVSVTLAVERQYPGLAIT